MIVCVERFEIKSLKVYASKSSFITTDYDSNFVSDVIKSLPETGVGKLALRGQTATKDRKKVIS